MKALADIVFIVLCANSIIADGIREKRGLNYDEQGDLLTVLNNDRAEIGKQIGQHMEDMTYDSSLEHLVAECGQFSRDPNQPAYVVLKMNSVEESIRMIDNRQQTKNYDSAAFFNPKSERIGCSKTFKCSKKLGKEFSPEFEGRIAEVYGACVFDYPVQDYSSFPAALAKVDLPPASKYGDVIGVEVPEEMIHGEVVDESKFYATEGFFRSTTHIPSVSTQENSSGRVFNIALFSLFLVLYV